MTVEDRMSQEELIAQFDEWAMTYEQDVKATDRFPFAGYPEALALVWERATAVPGMSVLDLGVGTGNLSKLFLDSGCHVLGVDFSPQMLAKSRGKSPHLELVQADLTDGAWPLALNRRFDRIVSNYMFHEFPREIKLRVLSRLARNHLVPGGRIIIGDITFPTASNLNRVKTELADDWEEEFYWIADETRAALEPAGWGIKYFQVSFCAGVYDFFPPTPLS